MPDDLTGALGSFSVYAALGNVRFNHAVSNKSFLDWRARHIQGGDFIAYTRPRHIRLTRDLLVSL